MAPGESRRPPFRRQRSGEVSQEDSSRSRRAFGAAARLHAAPAHAQAAAPKPPDVRTIGGASSFVSTAPVVEAPSPGSPSPGLRRVRLRVAERTVGERKPALIR